MKISKHFTELGKYCIDISKAIAITVVIAPLVKDGFVFECRQLVMCGIGVVAAIIFLTLGLTFINFKK